MSRRKAKFIRAGRERMPKLCAAAFTRNDGCRCRNRVTVPALAASGRRVGIQSHVESDAIRLQVRPALGR